VATSFGLLESLRLIGPAYISSTNPMKDNFRMSQLPLTVTITGMAGSGKTALAQHLKRYMESMGMSVTVSDADGDFSLQRPVAVLLDKPAQS
jgi:hypothetical protein